MVYKNKDKKFDKLHYRKLIFSAVLLIYFFGLCSGCVFAMKNADNFTFVQKVTFAQNLSEIENTADLAGSVKHLLREMLFVRLIMVFKYSGVLKSMCLCIPFIMAVQNTCTYTVLICRSRKNIFSLIFEHILKDTAVSFMILLYLTVVLNDIINNRTNTKKDIRLALIYSSGIILVNIIDKVIHFFR